MTKAREFDVQHQLDREASWKKSKGGEQRRGGKKASKCEVSKYTNRQMFPNSVW